MKNKKCLNEFIKYSFLNVFGMLGLSLYILADTFFIAKGLGPNGLTALNLAIPVYSIVHGMGLLIGIGGAIKYSIAKSRGRRGNAIFTNAIYLTIGIGIIFFIAGFFFADVVVKSMGADDSIFKMSKTYIQIILLFAPIFMLNNVLLCFVRNDDAPKLATIAMLTVRYTIAAVVTISIMVYMVIFCGAEYITLLFNSQGNLMLQTIAVKGLRIYFLAIPFAGFNIIITTYFASTSHTSLAHIISILRGFILMIPTAFILSRLADMTGVWLVFPLVEIMVGIMTVAMVKKAVALPCPSLPISGER